MLNHAHSWQQNHARAGWRQSLVASRLEPIASRLKAIALRVEAIAISFPSVAGAVESIESLALLYFPPSLWSYVRNKRAPHEVEFAKSSEPVLSQLLQDPAEAAFVEGLEPTLTLTADPLPGRRLYGWGRSVSTGEESRRRSRRGCWQGPLEDGMGRDRRRGDSKKVLPKNDKCVLALYCGFRFGYVMICLKIRIFKLTVFFGHCPEQNEHRLQVSHLLRRNHVEIC